VEHRLGPQPFSVGAEHALKVFAQTTPVDGLIVHATPATLVPYLGLVFCRGLPCHKLGLDFGLDLAPLPSTLQIRTMARAAPATLVPFLGTKLQSPPAARMWFQIKVMEWTIGLIAVVPIARIRGCMVKTIGVARTPQIMD